MDCLWPKLRGTDETPQKEGTVLTRVRSVPSTRQYSSCMGRITVKMQASAGMPTKRVVSQWKKRLGLQFAEEFLAQEVERTIRHLQERVTD